jgi:hypothetical protein
MDPNAALAEIRTIISQHNRDGGLVVAARLAELVDGLDGWLSKGGFLPAAWTHGGPRL